MSMVPLVNLLDCRATTSAWWSIISTSLRHTTLTRSLVHLHHDWVHNSLELFLLVLKLLLLRHLILIQPIEGLLHSLLNFVLVIALELILQLLLLQGVAHREAVVLQALLCFNLVLCFLIF